MIKKLFNLSLEELRQEALKKKIKRQKEFFAPLYLSNLCENNCPYCGFRKNSSIKRKTLTEEQINQEVNYLKNEGYDSVYCLTGSFNLPAMAKINALGLKQINQAGLFPILESSPFNFNDFKNLLRVGGGRGRFVLFQETYDKKLFKNLHRFNKYKNNFDDRLKQIELAIKAGWTEIGIGFLLGLSDNLEQELNDLIKHQKELLKLGVKKVTISVPRLNSATDIQIKKRCSDENFFKAIYLLNILCPESPLVLTGRESVEIRDRLWNFTDIWGAKGSTEPGGYTLWPAPKDGQFSLKDRRSVQKIINDNNYGPRKN